MAEPIHFYFDFSSPYGYFAGERIDALGAKHGRPVKWHPFLLGAVFKVTGSGPLPQQPMKGTYSLHDMHRTARLWEIPFNMPSHFPIASMAPSRAVCWAAASDEARSVQLARAFWRAFFVDDRDISKPPVTVEVAAEQGYGAAEVEAALKDQTVKDRLREETDQAIERGVFGSPFFIVDGEPFWGTDRMDHLDKWLERGGW